ncbi:MAG: hypothetical protein ACLFNJ_04265 [Bacteroidales bacterium]
MTKFYYAARQIAKAIGKYLRLNRAQDRQNRAGWARIAGVVD